MLDKDRIKESLTESDVVNIMTQLGSTPPSYQGNNLIFQTVCHNAQGGSEKLYYYPHDQTFNCYTNCGTMDIYSVVMEATCVQGGSMTFGQAVYFVANTTGRNYKQSLQNYQDEDIISDWEFLNRYARHREKVREKIRLKEYDEAVLNSFMHKPHISWIEEGIGWESMKKYEICYDWRSEKIVLPHRDGEGRLVGVRGRALRQQDLDKGQKYMPIFLHGESYAHSLGSNLYGLYQNRKAIERIEKVIIFEGEKSVIKCEDYYGSNNFSVAVCGGSLTQTQVDLILETGAKEIFLAMDKEFDEHGDNDSVEYSKTIYELAQRLTPYRRVYVVWDFEGLLDRQDSPADKGKEVLNQLLKQKSEILTRVE